MISNSLAEDKKKTNLDLIMEEESARDGINQKFFKKWIRKK